MQIILFKNSHKFYNSGDRNFGSNLKHGNINKNVFNKRPDPSFKQESAFSLKESGGIFPENTSSNKPLRKSRIWDFRSGYLFKMIKFSYVFFRDALLFEYTSGYPQL